MKLSPLEYNRLLKLLCFALITEAQFDRHECAHGRHISQCEGCKR